MADAERETDEPVSLARLRLAAAVIGALGILGCFWVIAAYVADPTGAAEPEKAGVTSILGFCAVLLSVAVFPFERLGLRIKSIGSVEFEQIVNTQALERVTDVSELREQLTKLQDSIATPADKPGRLTIQEALPELSTLVCSFLKHYSRWSFSPLRINTWGSQQSGFEQLAKYSKDDIRHVLQELTRAGRVRTTVSKKGSTLYQWINC